MGMDQYIERNGEEVCYWRKDYQLQMWMVDQHRPDVSECSCEIELQKSDVEEMLDFLRERFDTDARYLMDWQAENLEGDIGRVMALLVTTDWEKDKVTYSADW